MQPRRCRWELALQALEQIDPELLEVVRSAIGQGMFGMVPGGLDRVELGSVSRQPRIAGVLGWLTS